MLSVAHLWRRGEKRKAVATRVCGEEGHVAAENERRNLARGGIAAYEKAYESVARMARHGDICAMTASLDIGP